MTGWQITWTAVCGVVWTPFVVTICLVLVRRLDDAHARLEMSIAFYLITMILACFWAIGLTLLGYPV